MTVILYLVIAMRLNSNDIFTQIGLVVSPQRQPIDYSFEEATVYTAYLQIQLSEGKHQLLEIRNYDNPHTIAVSFCRKHKLNELAQEIVQGKIREAIVKQQQKLGRNVYHQRINQSSNGRMELEETKKSLIVKNGELRRQKSKSQTKVLQKKLMSNSKSKSKSKSKAKAKLPVQAKYNQQKSSDSVISPSRNESKSINPKQNKKKQNANKYGGVSKFDADTQQFNIHKNKKANPNIGNQLYEKAMKKNKLQEDIRNKIKSQQERQIDKQLTFQPKINPISVKIVEFRRQNPDPIQKIQKETKKQKENKRQLTNQPKAKEEDFDLKQCTFKPQINKVSDLILRNNHTYRADYDHFNALYKQAITKNDKLQAQIQKDKEKMFQPKINQRSTTFITETFQQRLQRSLIQKKKCREIPLDDSQYPFQPKIGRAPKDSRMKTSNIQSRLEQLHSEKLKKSKVPISHEQQDIQPFTISASSNSYYQNLIQKRISEVFQILDGDEDGYISPESISIECLTKNQLIFLKPIFQEMEELQAILDHFQFKRALTIMLNEADPSSKGIFLSQKRKVQERASFVPQINNKSKQIAHSRFIAANGNVYDQLYEMGLKQIQKKQYKLQKQRAKMEENQLKDCSFKPQLNNTSKYYIEKLIGKKLNQKFDDKDSPLS